MTAPLPPVTRVRCWVCEQMRPVVDCEQVQLAPRRIAWRCQGCSR